MILASESPLQHLILFETGSHYTAKTKLELTVEPGLVQISPFLVNFPNVGVSGVHPVLVSLP